MRVWRSFRVFLLLLLVPTSAYATTYGLYQNTSPLDYGIYAGGGTNNYFAGNVGIGTTSPGAKLDVNGGIHPGSATTGSSCSGNTEGTFAYDTSAHTPVYCGNSGNWAAVANSTSSPVLLNTLTASNSASLTDTTSLTGTYKSITFRFISLVPNSNGGDIVVRFSTNGGVSFDSSFSYAWGELPSEGSSPDSTNSDTAFYMDNPRVGISSNSTFGGLSGTLEIFNYASTSSYKTMTWHTSHANPSTNITGAIGSGYYASSAAVNAIQFSTNGSPATFASGKIEVWGNP